MIPQSLGELFDSLCLGESVTVTFPTLADYKSFHSQLRVVKHRKDKLYKSLGSEESLTEGKVIRLTEWLDENTEVTVFLDEPRKKRESKLNFTIINQPDGP